MPVILWTSSPQGSGRHNRVGQESRRLLGISRPVLVLRHHAECAHMGLCSVDCWTLPELHHALCGPRRGGQWVFVDEVSACRDLERVDLAAELQVLRPFFACSLNLLLALGRSHIEVLNG